MFPTAAVVVAAVVILAICVGTLYVVSRDGAGRRPTRSAYDTRRPEP
ncbi:hypothetical protein [Leucobacter sp.]